VGLKNFLWLAFLACLWGPSFLFIKVAVGEIPPLTLVTGRVGLVILAAGIYFLARRWRGRNAVQPVWRRASQQGLIPTG